MVSAKTVEWLPSGHKCDSKLLALTATAKLGENMKLSFSRTYAKGCIYAAWEFGVSVTSYSLPNLGSLFVSAWNLLFVVDFDVSMSLLLVPVESTFAFVKPVIMEIDICAIATLTGKAINREVEYKEG